MKRLALALAFAGPLHAQPLTWDPQLLGHLPPQRVQFDSAVRRTIEAIWDDSTIQQNERALCLTYDVRFGRWSVLYEVLAAEPAHVELDSTGAAVATPYSVRASCDPGKALLHVHTPTTCDDREGHGCRWGGEDAWQCEPSPGDQWLLIEDKQFFAVVMCDRHALVPYYVSTVINSLPR